MPTTMQNQAPIRCFAGWPFTATRRMTAAPAPSNATARYSHAKSMTNPPAAAEPRGCGQLEEEGPAQNDETDQHDSHRDQPGGVQDGPCFVCRPLCFFLLLFLPFPFFLMVQCSLLFVIHDSPNGQSSAESKALSPPIPVGT